MTSQSRAIRSQSRKIVKLVKISFFLNDKSTCNLTDVSAPIYDRKKPPDLLRLSTAFHDHTVSRKLFSNAELHQFGVSGTNAYETVENRRVYMIGREKIETYSNISMNASACPFWILESSKS